jgi:putative transposase
VSEELGWRRDRGGAVASRHDQTSPFKWFKTSPEVIHLTVMLCVPFPLSLRNAEDLLHELGVEKPPDVRCCRASWDRCSPPITDRIR